MTQPVAALATPRFAGQTALVTGGTKGIGKSIARALLAQAAAVAVTYGSDDEAADATAAEFEESWAARSLVLKADSTSPEAVAACVVKVQETLGPISILVNNVGMGHQKTDIASTPLEYWQRMLQMNLLSAVLYSRLVGPAMVDRGAGAIVNVSATSGLRALEHRAAHCSSKAALIMFTACCALEWGPGGVRVNAVAPGITTTDEVVHSMQKGAFDKAAALALMPLRRLASPDEIARAVLFLSSDEASYINGHAMVVDGGWTIHGGRY